VEKGSASGTFDPAPLFGEAQCSLPPLRHEAALRAGPDIASAGSALAIAGEDLNPARQSAPVCGRDHYHDDGKTVTGRIAT